MAISNNIKDLIILCEANRLTKEIKKAVKQKDIKKLDYLRYGAMASTGTKFQHRRLEAATELEKIRNFGELKKYGKGISLTNRYLYNKIPEDQLNDFKSRAKEKLVEKKYYKDRPEELARIRKLDKKERELVRYDQYHKIDPDTPIEVSHGGGQYYLNKLIKGQVKGYSTNSHNIGMYVTPNPKQTDPGDNSPKYYARRNSQLHGDTPITITGTIAAKHLNIEYPDHNTAGGYEAIITNPKHLKIINQISHTNMPVGGIDNPEIEKKINQQDRVVNKSKNKLI